MGKIFILTMTVLIMYLQIIEAQKGGAKGAMRNRGKGGKGRGGGSARGGRPGEDTDTGFGGQVDKTGKDRPCIGPCYLRKLRGEDPVPFEYKESCVGLCHLSRIRGLAHPTPRPRTPCIGLCYLAKLGKIKTEEAQTVEEYEEIHEQEGSAEDEYEDYEEYESDKEVK